MADLDPFALLADINATPVNAAPFPLTQADQAKYDAVQSEVAAGKLKQALLEQRVKDLDRSAAVLGGISQGLNPFSDEIIAGARALFGGTPYSEAIKQEQEALRLAEERDKLAFKTAEYGSILGSALTGGLAATAPKAGGVLTRAVEAVPGLKTLLGAETATTLPSLIRSGAVTGAAQGAGSAESGLENRLTSGAVGGLLGATLTPGLYYTGKAATQAAGDYLASKGVNISALGDKLKQFLSSETGAVGDIKPQWAPDIKVTFDAPDAATLEAARQLRNVKPEELQAAQDLIIKAQNMDLPIFLPEAVGTGGIKQSAQIVAQRPESVDLARRAIEGRANEQLARLEGVFNNISPEMSPFQGAQRMASGAQEIVQSLEKTRSAIVTPLYTQAREEAPEIVNESLNNLIAKDKNLASAINTVKSFAANADKSSTSLDVLDQAKRILDDKIVAAKKAGASNEARLIKATNDKLIEVLDSASPTYASARAAFEDASKGLNELDKTKLKMLLDIDPQDTQKIGSIFKYEPEQIKALKDAFEEAGRLEDFNAGIRGFLQRSIEAKKEGFDLAGQFTTPAMEKKLKAALGDKAESVIDAIKIEDKIAKGKREYLGGSTTRAQLAAESDLQEAASVAKEVAAQPGVLGKGMNLLAKALFEQPNEKFYNDLASIYFSPATTETLTNLSPLVQALRASKAAGEAVAGVAGSTAQRTAGRLEGEVSPPKPPTSGTNLAIGGAIAGTGIPEIDQILSEINSGNIQAAQPTAVPTPTLPANPTKKDLIPIIEQKAAQYGVPVELAKAVAEVESAYKVNAKSNKGATGVFQLMPGTAKYLGVDPNDPIQNIDGGIRYLAEQLKDFNNDPKLTVAAYNWGPARVKRAAARAKKEGLDPTWENILDVSWTPSETQGYVRKISAKIGNSITRASTDKDMLKYDDVNLAKIAKEVGQTKLDKVLAKYKPQQRYTVGDVLNALNLDAQELGVNSKSILGNA